MRLARGSRWTAVCLVVLAAHVGLAVLRIPGKVYAKRADEIARYAASGPARYLLGNARLGGAEVVEWLRAHVPPDEIVLWRGEADGAFEILAGLLAPRLLIQDVVVAAGATHHPVVAGGVRRIARGVLPDGKEGVLLLHARADDLALEVR